MSQPHLSQLNLWKKHEQRVLEVLLEALSILSKKTGLLQSEIYLNRELYFCLLEANHRLRKLGKGFDHPPVTEGKNPPSPDDEQRAKREDKIPDFSWGFIDDLASDSRWSARYFVIECKRLGKPSPANWILNENYSHHGMVRFITMEHGYAKNEISGAMVGYVQSMDFDEILQEVDAEAKKLSIAPLVLSPAGWQMNGTSLLSHKLTRPFLASSFLLKHIWVDMRSCYRTSSTPPVFISSAQESSENSLL